jgi:hypothetical protein
MSDLVGFGPRRKCEESIMDVKTFIAETLQQITEGNQYGLD